jgi:hypothetical protein
MDPRSPRTRPARRWPGRLLGIAWPLALAGAVLLAIAGSRGEGEHARADQGRKAEPPAVPRSKLPSLVKPPAHQTRPKRPRVRVPDVRGFRPRTAERALARRDLEMMAFGRESLLPSGTVVEQSPRAGRRVRPGRSIRVSIAIQPTGRVPEVTGHDVVGAAADLWALGLDVKFAYRRVRAPQRDGKVLAQSPPTGTRLRDGEVVWLLVARR